jgi:CBS domain containing-hemolysin-like protein
MTVADVLWRLGVVLLLVLANGFFVAAEFALVSVRPTRIDQLISRGNPNARLVRAMMNDPNRFISAAQLGITVASLLLGWVGEETFAELLYVPLHALLPANLAETTAHTVASLLALAGITFLHITLGEQVPKMIALQRAESTILMAVRPTAAIARIFRPFILVLYAATDFFLRLLGLEYRGEEQSVHSPEELRLLVASSARAGLILAPEREMLDRVFGFADLAAGEVIVPRTEVVAIPAGATLDQALQLALRHRYSRFPVYEESLDNIVGVLLVKDLLAASQQRRRDPDVRRLMRPPVFVPATLPAIEVLARMKAARAPLAVVLDEYGGTDGIVTLKDLVERVVGDVADEYAADVPNLRPQPDGTLLADGLTLVDDFNQRQAARLDSTEVDTLGGLALARLGRMANPGDEVDLGDGYRARVERLDGRRIAELRLWPPAPEPAADEHADNGHEREDGEGS